MLRIIALALGLTLVPVTEVMDKSIGVYCAQSCTITLYDFYQSNNQQLVSWVTVQHRNDPASTVVFCDGLNPCKTLAEIRAFLAQ